MLGTLGIGGGTPKATVSGTTGSPTITSITGYTLYKWGSSGAGSITFDRAGWVRVLVVAGGGGGGGNNTAYGGAAGSGAVQEAWIYVTPGTYNLQVGAAGSGSTGTGGNGGPSWLDKIYCRGGLGSSGNSGNTPSANGLKGGNGSTNESVSSDITGSSVTYGNPGQGSVSNPTARAANTGDGGRGASTSGGGAAGGSGVIYIAVPV
jgi:hypothetical protein